MSVTDRNRLDEASSPYLRQHADNPVNWQPWDEAALAAAEEREVPIFLSIGYSACHWCHVMEEESFQDETVAAALNDHYVPIKVDREERPDIDSIYQTLSQLVSGGGGWPLSVWLTPDGRPFYIGTYFPPEAKHGRPGFLELVEGLAEAWETDREDLERRADQWMRAIEGEVESVDTPGEAPDETLLGAAARSAVRSADREHGGFTTSGPKFPQPGRLHVLFRAYDRTDEEAYLEVAREALDAMADGGLFDHVGGGFHRYATDRTWTVPHFEKMLYDNAELPRVYLAGYQLTGEERYARVAERTLAFVRRELTHPEGGFYSTLDAQSGGEEGAFYVWTPEAIEAAIGDGLTADLFCDRYGITAAGNFEGHTVLTISESIEALAERYDLEPTAVEDRLADGRERAFAARSERERPARDEKVLAGWNGLMISAFAEAALVLGPEYARPAEDAIGFLREHCWDPESGRLHRRYKDGDVGIDGYLEDYAFLARGALDTYQATGAVEHLAFALDLARAIEREFWDADRGALYFTPASGEELVARPQELTDRSTPSSAGVAIETLAALALFTPADRFGTIVERALETYGGRVESSPLEHASLVLAADRHTAGSLELTVVAEDLPEPWRERIGRTYLPTRLLSVRPPGDALADWLDRLGLDTAPPIWADREQRDGAPTVYACRAFTCSPPETDLEAALEWAADRVPAPTPD